MPLSHAADPTHLDVIEAAYRAQGLAPAFRLAEAPGLDAVRESLISRGYVGAQPTLVKAGAVASLAAFHDHPADILDRPDAAWGQVFLGDGFDPVDGAHRVAALTRSPDALYGAVRDGGQTVAVGVVTFGHGWAGIHGMRTAQAHRGQGHAARILAALGRAAQARGLLDVFLQVSEENPARGLYRQAGFDAAWRYRYWTR